MKKFYLSILILGAIITSVYAQDPYFFPGKKSFNPSIPSPENFFGYQIGTRQTDWDQLLAYFKELARLSDRTSFEIIGYTYEKRPLIILTVSSPNNIKRLEQIRTDHLKVRDPALQASQPDLPVIDLLAFNVHGNESSGAEAAILTAYYLVASEDAETKEYLEKGVYLIDPLRNPDGHERHTSWVNSNQSKEWVSDPLDREHNEVWPGGRGNHYWFDLNRGWLPAVHRESQARLDHYYKWFPQVATCHHEQGAGSTFFFEPTQPITRESPIVPQGTYDINKLFANYYSAAFNSIGSLYYTKEAYDNFNPTFGSSFPDYTGSIAILFEQAGSRGFVQETANGNLTFRFAIRNQLTASLATINASVKEKDALVSNQKEFFRTAFEQARKGLVKAYIWGDKYDISRNRLFAELLIRHKIDFFENNKTVAIDGKTFESGKSYYVPLEQSQYRLVRLFFDRSLSIPDSVFYDGSSWTQILSTGLSYAEVRDPNYLKGNQVTALAESPFPIPEKSTYGYVLDWRDYSSFRALYQLQKSGVATKAGSTTISIQTTGGIKEFGPGSILIPVVNQTISIDSLYHVIQKVSSETPSAFYSVQTGFSISGVDLGSDQFKKLEKPRVLLITGQGLSSLEAGAVWYLLDQQIGLPVTKADLSQLSQIDYTRYNSIIIVSTDQRNSGSVTLNDAKFIDRLKIWINEGGTLITINSAVNWAIEKDLVTDKLVADKSETESKTRFNYDDRVKIEGAKTIGGTIFQTDVDITHPLGFGYTNRKLPVIKNNRIFLEPSANPFQTVVKYDPQPLLSGFIQKSQLNKLKASAAVVVNISGKGRTILFSVDPTFRAFWYGTSRLFYNSIYFGQTIQNAARNR